MSSKKIYGTFESENSWLKDPSVPENIIFDGVTSIVNLKVISIGEAEILPKSEDFYSSTPHTPIQVEIIDIFSGEAQSGKQTIYIEGGDIKISKLIESVDKDTIAKMEFEKLSKDQKDSMYVSYNSQHDFKMKTVKEYGVILVEKIEGIYVISERGYGIFDIPKTKTVNGTNMYKNVLTGKESDIKNLKKK